MSISDDAKDEPDGPKSAKNLSKRALKEKARRHKKITRKHKEFELTYDMMLGIRTMVGQTEAKPPKKLLSSHFNETRKLYFPSQGSSTTPGHEMRSFMFKDYASEVFRRIRERFGISPQDYLLTLCGNFHYLEFISNSKSGEFFFYSYDHKFMIKTISPGESKFLRKVLPGYYEHIMNNPSTLLTRYYGMHRVEPHRKKEKHFLVMASVFYTNHFIHFTFDLKGSLHGRVASEKEKRSQHCVFKDQDFLEQKTKINV